LRSSSKKRKFHVLENSFSAKCQKLYKFDFYLFDLNFKHFFALLKIYGERKTVNFFGWTYAKIGWNFSKLAEFFPNRRTKNQPWFEFWPTWSKFDQNWLWKLNYAHSNVFERFLAKTKCLCSSDKKGYFPFHIITTNSKSVT
jgi:hypothetical protein